jgi:hypothetical protein
MHSEEENQTEHEVDHRFDSLATNVADTARVPESQLYAAYHAVIALEPEAAGDRGNRPQIDTV